MQFLQPLRRAAIRQSKGFPQAAAAAGLEQGVQPAPAGLQGQVPEVGFDRMDGGALVEDAGQHVQHLRDEGLQQFGFEGGEAFGAAYRRVSWQGKGP